MVEFHFLACSCPDGSNTICWRGYFYFILCFWPVCQILMDQRGKGVFLGSLICSIDLCVCSYASTRLFCYSGLVKGERFIWSEEKPEYTVALKYSLISGIVILSTLFFFLKTAAATWGHFWFHINFWNICFKSLKYAGCI